MPDPEVVRSRRSRAHRRGDHSLCQLTRCDALDGEPLEPPTGAVAEAVRLYGETLGLQPGDVRAPMIEAALVLARALDESGPLPDLARELRMQLGWLAEFQAASIPLDEIRTRRAQRRAHELVERHLGGAS